MAGFFDKLMSMGQAHAQHVQALQAALRNPDMQSARDQLASYLQGLSDTGLLGFKTSLALITNSEPNPQVRVSLQWVVAHVDGLRAGQFAAAPPQSLATSLAIDGINLQQTAALVVPWLQMAPQQRQEQLHSTLQALSKSGRKAFVSHLDTVLSQAQQQIQRQAAADNNSRAWGNAIEDQMAYLQAHLKAGISANSQAINAEQQAALQALQQLVQQARQWQPAKASAAPATRPVPAAHAAQAAQAQARSSAQQLAALHQQLPEHSAGLDPARQAALHDYLTRVTQMQQAHEQRPALGPNATLAERQADLQASMAHTHAMRQELQALAELQRHVRRQENGDLPTPDMPTPNRPTPELPSPEPSRAATLLPLIGALIDSAAGLRASIHVANDINESTRLEQLHNALVTARARVQQLAALPDSSQVLHFERDSLRHAVQAVQRHHRRGHLMVARPIWPTGPAGAVRPDPSCVVLAGAGADVHHRVQLACQKRLLHISPPAAPGVDPALAQWQALQSASLVVLDLTTPDPQVYYQLGQAYALGSQLLLLARSGTTLPFDVAQAVLHYNSADDLASQLPAALDAALYGVQTLGLTGLMHHNLKHCKALLAHAVGDDDGTDTEGQTNTHTNQLLGQLTAQVNSPLGFAAALDQLLAQLGNPRLVLLHPRWPARYPNLSPLARRCFVVMPFSTQLASTQAMYRQLCSQLEAQGVLVVRGDGAAAQDIVASIWEETARASHVLVDLTGYNPNVCLELGMADAMGRDTLLFGAAGTAEARFLAISKRRIHSYGDSGSSAASTAVQDTAAAFVQRSPTLL